MTPQKAACSDKKSSGSDDDTQYRGAEAIDLGKTSNLSEEDNPTNVLLASMQFERSLSSLTIPQHQPPPPRPFDHLRRLSSSSSSLYPTAESVSKDSSFSEINIERSWNRAASRTPPSGSARTRQRCTDEMTTSDIATATAIFPGSSSLASIPLPPSTDVARSYASRIDPPHRNFAARNSAYDDEDEDLLQQKIAAYGGGFSSNAVALQPTGTYVSATPAEAQIVDYDVHPAELTDNNAVRAQLVGSSSVVESSVAASASCPSPSCAVPMESRVPSHTDSFVTSFHDEYHAGFNSVDGAAVAAFNQASRTTMNQTGTNSIPSSFDLDSHPPIIAPGTFQPQAMVAAATNVEATVIASGPAGKATIEAWSASPAAEATVLAPQQSDSEMDSKPAAIDYGTGTTTDRLRTDVLGTSCDEPAMVTMVDYDVHPSEISGQAVQAVQEAVFVGGEVQNEAQLEATSFHNQLQVEEVQDVLATDSIEREDDIIAAQPEITGSEDQVAEATVISSGPAHKATTEAWSAEPAPDAIVMSDATYGVTEQSIEHEGSFVAHTQQCDVQEEYTESPHADVTVEAEPDSEQSTSDQPAEVLGIVEDVHPTEWVAEPAVQADLVALQDTGESILSHSGADVLPPRVDSSSTRTDVPSEMQSARATLVNNESEDDTRMLSHPAYVQRVESIFATYAGNETGEELPATPVAVLEIPEQSADSIYPVKEGDCVTRGEATQNGEAIGTEDLNALDPGWMRVPSFGGNADEDAPLAIPPPMAQACATPVAPDVVGTPQFPSIPPPDVVGTPQFPSIPPPVSIAATTSSARCGSRNSTDSGTDSRLCQLSTNITRGTSNVMEILFGNATPGRGMTVTDNSMVGSVLPRTLLPSSVIFSEGTKSWVATVNTNQKALEANNVVESSKALRAFSVPSQKQAIALATAWSPPKMHPFDSNRVCFVCEGAFAVFKRASHCRNCGVCICSTCAVHWPSKMVPDTYNIKREALVSICKACDWLCSKFRGALLDGDHDKSVALYSTGNINLTTPFANVKGELFYPVHCAVLGGNLALLKWLVDEHCCPLRSIRISNGKQRDPTGSYTPILTSRGRSLLGIALANKNIGIVRYLVVEKRMLLAAEKGLTVDNLVQNLDLVLRILPEELLGQQFLDQNERSLSITEGSPGIPGGSQHGNRDIVSETADFDIPDPVGNGDNDDQGRNECIICFSNEIDCVATPCGHQICCLECGTNIPRCPVCLVECSFMRVFRA